MLPAFPDVKLVLGGFLIINISSAALAVCLALLPALLYWGLWLIYSSSFWKAFSVLLSFFTISNNNIHFMVYCNHSSLVIFVNDAKYIHFYPTFQLPPTLSHCKYKPFIKSIKFCLFRYRYWLKHFPAI